MKKIFVLFATIFTLYAAPVATTVVVAETTACHATPAELQQTFVDGLKDAGCILGQVFAGTVTVPGIALQCANATAQVVADVIVDFYEKAPSDDAGVGAPPGTWRGYITLQQKSYCDQALANAVAAGAVKKGT